MVEQAKRKAAEARDAEYKEAAARAGALWNEAGPAPAAHAYLITKGITPDGARIGKDGRLLVPVYGADGLQSLQFIAPDAVKRFLGGAKMKGGCANGPPVAPECVFLVEGWATGKTVHAATRAPVCACFLHCWGPAGCRPHDSHPIPPGPSGAGG